MSRRVVVFGASGFIGQSVVHWLREANLSVGAYGSADCDLTNATAVRDLLADEEKHGRLDIVHCAGLPRIRVNDNESASANARMAQHVKQALSDAPRSMVYLSSTDVYGLPSAESPIRESTPATGTSPYAQSKQEAEAAMLATATAWGERTAPIACLRLPGVYGPGDHGRSVIGNFIGRLVAGEALQLTGDGETARDFIHVDDLCALIVHLLANPFHGVLNVATGQRMTPRLAVECIAQALGVEAKITWLPPNPDRDHDLVFDTRQLKSVAGKLRFRGLRDGVAAMLSKREQTP